MPTQKLSEDARRLRNEYVRESLRKYRQKNPNHANEYWERKAQKLREQENIDEVLTACFSKTPKQSNESYKKGLEESNKTMAAEIKRLLISFSKKGISGGEYIDLLTECNKHLRHVKATVAKYAIKQQISEGQNN
jgi:uncharacterized membrane-anchored protein YjiN (DUF445 family)